jgi:hypothetical protein
MKEKEQIADLSNAQAQLKGDIDSVSNQAMEFDEPKAWTYPKPNGYI